MTDQAIAGGGTELETTGNAPGKKRVMVRNAALVLKVVEARKEGKSISQITRELHLSRPTVRKYLANAGELAENYQEQIDSLTQSITQAAYKAIEAQILDRKAPGDGRLALDWMKLTVFAEKRSAKPDPMANPFYREMLEALRPVPLAVQVNVTNQPAPAADAPLASSVPDPYHPWKFTRSIAAAPAPAPAQAAEPMPALGVKSE